MGGRRPDRHTVDADGRADRDRDSGHEDRQRVARVFDATRIVAGLDEVSKRSEGRFGLPVITVARPERLAAVLGGMQALGLSAIIGTDESRYRLRCSPAPAS